MLLSKFYKWDTVTLFGQGIVYHVLDIDTKN